MCSGRREEVSVLSVRGFILRKLIQSLRKCGEGLALAILKKKHGLPRGGVRDPLGAKELVFHAIRWPLSGAVSFLQVRDEKETLIRGVFGMVRVVFHKEDRVRRQSG